MTCKVNRFSWLEGVLLLAIMVMMETLVWNENEEDTFDGLGKSVLMLLLRASMMEVQVEAKHILKHISHY